MTDAEAKELKIKEKQEVASPAEQTRPGPVFTPDVDIFETDQLITLLADMPGVTPENVTIDLRDNVLTLTGEVDFAEKPNEDKLIIEYEVGQYYRQFTLSEVVNQEKIDAKLADGVLRLTLPKVAKAAPRKITVTSS